MIIKKTTVTANGISLKYVLQRKGDVYSIEITEQVGTARTTCRFNDIARSKEAAMRLFHLLSANAVCPTTAPYVLDDLAESVTF